MSRYRLRRLAPDEAALEAVSKLVRDAFADLPGAPSARLSLAAIRRMAEAGPVLVVEQAGAPVACLFLRPSRDVAGALYMGTLAVARAARGGGLARRLIEAAAGIGEAGGYRALTLDTGARQAGLRRLFASAGFSATAEGAGIVQMQRPLAAAPWRVGADSDALPAILALIRRAFAPMRGRIDPPSSAERLDLAAIRAQARAGEIWAIGTPPVACIFLTPPQGARESTGKDAEGGAGRDAQEGALYLSKLAVDPARRGGGLARRLLAQAEARARALGLARLTLKARIELSENHAFFRQAGFVEAGRECHPGFDSPTTLLFARELRR